MRRALAVVAVLALLAALAAGCDDDGGAELAATATPALRFGAGYPVFRDQATGIRTIFGTPDLAPGEHRVGWVMSDDQGLISLPVLRVDSYYFPDGPRGRREGRRASGAARFFPFPYGTRGMYTLRLAFDRPGTWGLEVFVPRPDGSVATTAFAFVVAERTRAVPVGAQAPASRSRTLADVRSIAELSTGSEPDPALYEKSIAAALAERRPLVLVFASPAFCTNELCGPQVEVLSELRRRYADRANFIHVDLYENPHEIRGDLARAVRTTILAEWGVPTDEWTFVIDGHGRVAERYESFVTEGELEEALRRILG